MATALNPSQALVYDPRYMEFDHWAALMCEQYAAQQLSIAGPDTDWQEWASGLMAIDVFLNQGIASPYAFDDWQDWAAALVNVMNGGVQ